MAGPFYFAWAGGTLQEQVELSMRGATHGGIVETVSFVGDTNVGINQISNIGTDAGFVADQLYSVTGPGVDFAYFVSIPSTIATAYGEIGTVDLSVNATATLRSATYVATQAQPAGTVVGTIIQGSDTVVFPAGFDLLPGTYGIIGTGIGQTLALDGSTVYVNSAVITYDGSGSAQMYNYAGPITATTSGDYSMLITGLPTDDWYSVTGIDDLGSLTPGLAYNISGNGIPVGTTFVAPDSGNSITLDLPATSSDLNALLTITGPRTPNAAVFDPAIHDKFDEEIISIEIAQEEGGFATLTVQLRNPSVGLLATGRQIWCWLSWDQAWTPEGGSAPVLVPIFNGRLVGVPQLQAGEVVQLQFLARPDDFNSQKLNLATSLQVLPYYDPVWIAATPTADTTLETYSKLWHIDRTSLAVTTSDITQGEDGIITIGEDQAIYEHFALSYQQPPIIAVTVEGTVSWSQQAEGLIDVTQKIVDAFSAVGGTAIVGERTFATYTSGVYQGLPVRQSGEFNTGTNYGSTAYNRYTSTSGGGGNIKTLNGEGLKSDWPRPGTNIGGGWSLTTRNDPSGVPLCYIEEASWTKALQYNVRYAQTTSSSAVESTSGYSANVQAYTNPVNQYQVGFPINTYKVRMNLEYHADRKRTETVRAVVTANVQPELSDSSESDREAISLTSQYIAQGVDDGGAIPIGDLAHRSYFQLDRGASSFEYLLLLARAKIRARARAVDITFAVDWPTALNISLRNSVALLDRRLPGGTATGKVKSYKLQVSGGTMFGEFVIGCTIGAGDPSIRAIGINTYVEDGYVDPGYQIVEGGQFELLSEELSYQSLDQFIVVDDGLDLTNITPETAVNECFVTNGLTTVLAELDKAQDKVDPAVDPRQTAQELNTKVTLDLKPVAGSEFHTNFFPAVSALALPKTLDLSLSRGMDCSIWDESGIEGYWDVGDSIWDEMGASYDLANRPNGSSVRQPDNRLGAD